MIRVLRTILGRLVHMAVVLSRHALAEALSRPWVPAFLRRPFPLAGLPAPERLRLAFEEVGGTFVKLGQMLALQPDVVPRAYCDALLGLLDRVGPFPFADVLRIVEEELGRPAGEVFDEIEEEPLATASVGQVHVARIRGEKVAVKVQRPNVEVEFSSDVRLMRAAMSAIRVLRLRPLDWLLEPVNEFVVWTREELDYRFEASYSEHLRRLAAGNPAQVVPRVYRELTRRRLLVVEFLDGTTLLDVLRCRERGDELLARRLADRGFDPRLFAAHVIDNFLGDAFRHGIYHADLHPANLMVLDQNAVGYVDFGITGVLAPASREHLMKMTLALARGDLRKLQDEFLEITVWGEGSDLEGFRAGLEELASGWYEGGVGGTLTASFTRIMGEMLKLSRTTRVMPERDIVKYIRSSIAIDGLISRFAPDFDLGAHLADRCARLLRTDLRRRFFGGERLLAAATAGARLLESGAPRGARLLDRLERLAEAELRPRPEGWRAAGLAAVVLAAAGLVAAADQPSLGLNLWTAEVAFFGGAAMVLVAHLRRLGRA